ncbi:MAG: hypothetical protein IKW01_02400 [Firmicutes bacterium]|nr:hypothetical protein [Bacillota bacterium]
MLNKKKVYIVLAAVMALMGVIEVLWAHPHYHMVWNTVPGADIIIGFAGAWALIILTKKIMAGLLQREEGYYETDTLTNSSVDHNRGGGGYD